MKPRMDAGSVLEKINQPECMAARETHEARLDALFAGETPESLFRMDGIEGRSKFSPYTHPKEWVNEALADLAGRVNELLKPCVFHPLLLEAPLYGMHFTDAVFGAEMIPETVPDSGEFWNRRLAHPVGELKPPRLENSLAWKQARALAEAMRESGATVPYFVAQTWSSPLNIAINLYGQRFPAALLLEPVAARRDLRTITDAIKKMARECREWLGEAQYQPCVAAGRLQPPGYGQLCGCSTHLLSCDQYAELVAPLDDEILADSPRGGGMMHLCGKHARHIPVWREMKAVRSIQLTDEAADDFPAYFAGTREDQVIYLNPTETMTACRAGEISGGRRLVVVARGCPASSRAE